ACLPGPHLLSTRGAEHLLMKGIQELSAERSEPLTFNDVRAWLRAYKARSREVDWKVSATSVLTRLTTGPLGHVFNADANGTFRELLAQPVILQIDALGGQTDRAAFVNAMLLWLYYHRLAEGRSGQCKHVLFIEEAHHCFLRHPEGRQSLPDLMLRQMRDLGQALVLIDQNPSLLSVPALGNTATTICLNLKHADDIEAAGKALTLPKEQWDYIGRLQVGQGIVKVPRCHSTPFLVCFPLFPVSLPSEPSRANRRPSCSDSLKRQAEQLREALSEAIRAFRETDRTEQAEPRIGTSELSMLIDIAQYPIAPVTQRYKRLGWSAHTGTKIKRSLLEKGLVEEERVKTPEGLVALLRLTRAGRDLLKSRGVQARALPKNASLEHEYWKHRIAEDYRRRGYQVEEEVHIGGGRSVDLVATGKGERIAIEIETGKSDESANQRKCAQARFRRTLVVRPFQATPARLQKRETTRTKHPD
ncbi:MAG: hypothetical protein QI223_09785, partial [Candidatus Korarchaeota archaeon]|nr:hypothetical protein [Candidatus Korarchaeota archaeon]